MHPPVDVFASLALGAFSIIVPAAHARLTLRTRYQRVTQQGATFFLGFNLMNAGYWMLQPAIRRCCEHRVSANTISWLSLLPAVAAALAAATGHWGFAAWALLGSALLDVMDGAVARASGQTSPAGAVLDSVLDRYAESIVFAGLLAFYRNHIGTQLIIMAALVGSFLVTYSTAKAEALRLKPPRGSMKRSDRLTVLILGSALAPLSQYWLEIGHRGEPAWPVVAAVAVIAVLANYSAVQRFSALADEARRNARPDAPAVTRATPSAPLPKKLPIARV